MAPEELSQEDIDALLASGGDDGELGTILGSPHPASFDSFDTQVGMQAVEGQGGGGGGGEEETNLEMLFDVELDVKIELGRTYMSINDILSLQRGSVVQLDKDAGAPVDILINGRLVAFGEVLVLNDYFCVRVTEILSDKERAIAKR